MKNIVERKGNGQKKLVQTFKRQTSKNRLNCFYGFIHILFLIEVILNIIILKIIQILEWFTNLILLSLHGNVDFNQMNLKLCMLVYSLKSFVKCRY